ncbi:MAG: HDOD domain-containing protein [Gammaproteobacteria bacterium]|nr:HDOD domain-containing protein [Gammaproteobacteria bacterium]
MTNLETLIQQSGKLPSLPEIYVRVAELLGSDDSTAPQIGEALQTDPMLTAKILTMINSAYYGLPNKVTSISHAVALLGRGLLKHMLLRSVLGDVFSNINIPNFSMQDFWHHSVKTAIIARHLAMQNVNILDHEAFFTAGLLHDIGKLVIAKATPHALAKINEKVENEDMDPLEAETAILGFTHLEVGGALMQKWGMPPLLTQCVISHHDASHEGPLAVETAIVAVANQLSHLALAEDEVQMEKILETIPNWQQIDSPPEQIHIACQLADKQWVEVMGSLGMQGRDKRSIA